MEFLSCFHCSTHHNVHSRTNTSLFQSHNVTRIQWNFIHLLLRLCTQRFWQLKLLQIPVVIHKRHSLNRQLSLFIRNMWNEWEISTWNSLKSHWNESKCILNGFQVISKCSVRCFVECCCCGELLNLFCNWKPFALTCHLHSTTHSLHTFQCYWKLNTCLNEQWMQFTEF